MFKLLGREALIYSLENVIMKRLPRSAMIHNVVRLFLDDRLSNHINTKFYAFNGIVDSADDSFIVAKQHRSFFDDIAITTSEPEDLGCSRPDVIRAFEETIDWKSYLAFKTTFNGSILKGWCKNHGEIVFHETCYAYHMDMDDALAINPKPVDGYKVGNLHPKHGTIIANIWPYSVFPGTPSNMIDIIENVGGVGIYQDEKICSWIINSTNGQMLALHVLEKHRRKGLAEWVLYEMAKTAAQEGLFPNAMVEKKNLASRRLFEKLGFKKGKHVIEEIRYKPK